MLNTSHDSNHVNINNNNNQKKNKRESINSNVDNQKDVNSTAEMASFASSLPTIDQSEVNMNSAVEINVNGQATQGTNDSSQRVKHLYVPANDSHENLSFGQNRVSNDSSVINNSKTSNSNGNKTSK